MSQFSQRTVARLTASAALAMLSAGFATSALAAGADPSLFNIEGYAAVAGVTGGGVYSEDDPRYIKVATADEFLKALASISDTDNEPYRVIEITADLDLGYDEAGGDATAAKYPFFKAHNPALTSAVLKKTGVSKINLTGFDGLTIYSKNGATIRHAGFNIDDGQNLIIRNLTFDEMWEWDEKTAGDYDENDWDYITIGNSKETSVGAVWIDHCTFYKAYDGIVDIKRGASNPADSGPDTQAQNGITISWTKILPGSGNPDFMKEQFDALEADRAAYPFYDFLRSFMTEDQIMAVEMPVKKGHLIGSSSKKEKPGFVVTLAHNYYKDLQDRMPRLRTGDVQVYNLVADASDVRETMAWYDKLLADNPDKAAKLSGDPYKLKLYTNGSISTESGAVMVRNSVYKGVQTPLRNNQSKPEDPSYTGAIEAFNTRMELLAGADDNLIPAPQSTITDESGTQWIVWQGDSGLSGTPLGPTEAPPIPFKWNNGEPPAPQNLFDTDKVEAVVTSDAGAGAISLSTAEWLNPINK
ncbi:hypothetical protein [Martelella sp. HB161492]|uniref:pectate lyase family protein n=1 Tax=Martelella sp. HB161492 TaxID=2720726 RepID=UPI001590DEFE|nr:hypothetical protein [Martelella sp. HB161492]